MPGSYRAFSTLWRRIEHDYPLQVLAGDPTNVVEHERRSLKAQLITAANSIELVDLQESANHSLDSISQEQRWSNRILESLRTGLEGFAAENATLLREQTDLVGQLLREQTNVIEDGLNAVAEEIRENRRALDRIAALLSQPYETKVRELMAEAQRALKAAMCAAGDDRIAELDDAEQLLLEVLKNPIGARNPFARFRMGWLHWRRHDDLTNAEKSFGEAQRLGRSHAAAGVLVSAAVRHRAYMQYLMGDFAAAHRTIQDAVAIDRRHDVLYDAARYAFRVGRGEEGVILLEQCIDLRPTTFHTMLAEEDFRL